MGSEVININKGSENDFVVERKIPKDKLLLTSRSLTGFWSIYYSLLDNYGIPQDQYLTVTSNYKFNEDSNFIYKTITNGKLIDSGIIETVRLNISGVNHFDGLFDNPAYTDSTSSVDTVIVKEVSGGSIDYHVQYQHFYSGGIRRKSIVKRFQKGILYDESTVIFSYTNKSKVESEKYYDKKGNLIQKKTFSYFDQNNYTILTETFDYNGNLVSCQLRDDQLKILESKYYYSAADANKRVEKRVYKYLNNGLLSEEMFFLNNHFVKAIHYEYQ